MAACGSVPVKEGFFPNGNFRFEDDFTSPALDFRWIGLRGPREDFISIAKKGGLQIAPFSTQIKDVMPTSTLFYRQQHSHFTANTTLNFKPRNEAELAGITCYQSERFNYVFGITKKDKDYFLLLAKTQRGKTEVVAKIKITPDVPVSLKVEAKGNEYRFYYSVNSGEFANLGGTVSGDILSTNVAGGFTGSLIGLYATTGNDIMID